jgi:acyl-CoA synthetase (AMP-forming)/AMP-acid ligase II
MIECCRSVEMIKLRQGGIIDDRQPALARLKIVSIRLSSGTTGRSKGIMISEDAIWWRAECNSAMHQVISEDCIIYLIAMDLASPHFIAASGATGVVEEAHNFDAIRRICANHRVTHVHTTPLFYQMITTQLGLSCSDFPWIRYSISTGAPLPATVADGFHEKFGREITQYYRLAECGPVFVNVSNDSSKRGAAGVLLPGWEINFTGKNDSDSSDLGELLVRGPGLFHGYYDRWQAARDVLVDGWFRTGDLVRCDQDGFYWIGGRSKDLINVGGTKVFPWEIENILMSHPDTEEALVYGQRDARFGEVPHAKVKARSAASVSERELLHYVNERVSILKNLRKLEFVSALSRTNTGKLKRWE